MGALGDGEVNSNPSTVNLLIIHGIFGSLSILCVFVVDESKATGSTSLSVKDDSNFFKRSKLGKLLFQFSFSRVEAQPKDSDALRDGRLFTASNMATTIGHGGSAGTSAVGSGTCFGRTRSGPGVPPGVARRSRTRPRVTRTSWGITSTRHLSVFN